MEREITHSCGHVARHFVGGMFASDGDAKVRRLARMGSGEIKVEIVR